MGLLQKAVETYESHLQYASVSREGTTKIAPVSHVIVNAMFEITIDSDGIFRDATKVDKADVRTIIPVTVASAGRTSNDCAHPLCDQLSYIATFNEKRHELYVEQLSAWTSSQYSHSKAEAVLKYAQNGTVLADLQRCRLISLDDQMIPKEKNGLIRWRILGEDVDACWLDYSLMDAYIKYDETKKRELHQVVDMVSGGQQGYLEVHPRGIVPKYKSAKIISSDDDNGYTFRGRFCCPEEALTVGIDSSQKAHNALRWLVDNQGVKAGERVFLCWNPQGREIPGLMNPLVKNMGNIFKPSDYKEELYRTLLIHKSNLGEKAGVVIAAFDATTDNTGRLSVTYYNELRGSDFLHRLYEWDNSCSWPHRYYGVCSPSLYQIVNYSFGIQRTEKGQTEMETDARIFRQQVQRMVSCRVDKTAIGADVVKALVNRASNMVHYKNCTPDGHQQENIRENLLFTACAVIRKYRTDRFKEEWNMALEPEKKDRSYQFGRLLAVMEKAERDTYDSSEGREPNAIRLQSIFCQRPMSTADNLEKQLERAYFPRLKPGSRIWYKNLMGQIMGIISEFPQEDWNKPLDATYLMGYYLQRSALYTKKTDNEMEENEQ